MKYVRRIFTIPEDVVELLDKERNKSARVTETLRDYYENKDSLGSLNNRLGRLEDFVTVIKREVSEIKQLAGGGRGY